MQENAGNEMFMIPAKKLFNQILALRTACIHPETNKP
jgi:hypothetical protein